MLSKVFAFFSGLIVGLFYGLLPVIISICDIPRICMETIEGYTK